MEIAIGVVAFVGFAKGVQMLGSAYGRAGPAGIFGGMFAAPGLGWPTGVQEEDRDRLWTWEEPAEQDDAELVDLPDAAVPVRPVR